MKRIIGYLTHYGYTTHRVYVAAIISVGTIFLNNRGFDIPAPVMWINQVVMWAVMISVFLPLAMDALPVLIMYIRRGFRLPTKDNYANKSDYILPFTGKWTVGNGGFKKGLYHSGFIGSERNAYDFSIMEDDDGTIPDDWTLPTTVEEYPCYGKDIIAIADGVVIKAVNHHPDSRTNGIKVYCDTWQPRGNYIVVKHNESEYSLTAHLMPGSITVKRGDKVKQGEVIAKCGNSGNCTAPHIHFQLQSGANFFTAMSLPIAFTNITAVESQAHKEFCAALGRKPAKFGENIEIVGNKTYIGRGLDVENK